MSLASLLVALALGLASCADRPPAPPAAERVLPVDLLDNGDFAESAEGIEDEEGRQPIPWWRSAAGRAQLVEDEGRPALRTGAGQWAEQPVAAYAPLVSGLVIEGQVSGAGRVVIVDGPGGRASFEFPGSGWRTLRIDGASLSAQLGRAAVPRLVLRLEPLGEGAAHWRGLHVRVPLPCPDEAALRAEIHACLRQVVEPWLARGLDDFGPRKTGFLARIPDAESGEPTLSMQSASNAFWEQLSSAAAILGEPRWAEAARRSDADLLALGLDARTGLPHLWDARRDVPIDTTAVEIAGTLDHLIDLAERGPEELRAPARAAALKMGETVLAKGVQPDDGIGAKYFPATGEVDPGVVALRRFDVPAQLARLTALTHDERFLEAAGEALASFEFTHVWQGTWWMIDSAFDDEFGHYAARAVTIARAAPQDALFRNFALEGWRHYRPLWRDALRLGGNVAADQVRCWVLLAELAELDAAAAEEIRPLLCAAVRSHVKGEQYGDGAWGDVTIFGFDPKPNLQVGDYPGAPQNLLHGLAALYRADLGLRTDEQRALYTAVLRSSMQAYLLPKGFLLGRTKQNGPNPAAGTLRMMLGLTKMLRALG